jgi:hypothetical protein
LEKETTSPKSSTPEATKPAIEIFRKIEHVLNLPKGYPYTI